MRAVSLKPFLFFSSIFVFGAVGVFSVSQFKKRNGIIAKNIENPYLFPSTEGDRLLNINEGKVNIGENVPKEDNLDITPFSSSVFPSEDEGSPKKSNLSTNAKSNTPVFTKNNTPASAKPETSIGRNQEQEVRPTRATSVQFQKREGVIEEPRTLREQRIDNQIALNEELTRGALTALNRLGNVPMPDNNIRVGDDEAFQQQFASGSSDFYLDASLEKPRSPYEIKTGSFIPAVLMSKIVSDLSGQITAQVSSPVYDSVTGNYLLIPQGSKLFGTFLSAVNLGQKRVFVIWLRLILPNGSAISLKGMTGVDASGSSGFKDLYESKFLEAIGSAALLSIISGTSSAVINEYSRSTENTKLNRLTAETGESFVEQLAAISADAILKSINTQPTITIRSGYLFNVFVNKDMILEPYE